MKPASLTESELLLDAAPDRLAQSEEAQCNFCGLRTPAIRLSEMSETLRVAGWVTAGTETYCPTCMSASGHGHGRVAERVLYRLKRLSRRATKCATK